MRLSRQNELCRACCITHVSIHRVAARPQQQLGLTEILCKVVGNPCARQSTATQDMARTPSQTGGTITSDIARLAVPLGLILSRTGLEKLMARRSHSSSRNKKPAQRAKPVATIARRATMSGGESAIKRRVSPRRDSVEPLEKAVVRVQATSKPLVASTKSRTAIASLQGKPKPKPKPKSASKPKAASPPLKKAVGRSPSKGTTERNATIRKQFQEIARKVQEIFAKARLATKNKRGK